MAVNSSVRENMDIETFFSLLIGAGFGAFFAVLKSKSERLWQERFEALKELCLALNTLIHSHESGHLEDLGVRVMGDAERERLSSDVLDAKQKLRSAMANLNLLFKEKYLASIEGAYVAMTSAMTDLHNAHPAENRSDYMRVVSMNAETLIRDAKQLAKKKIL